MTEIEQEDKIQEYFSYFLEELPYRDVLDLFLMFIDKRPACLIMNLEEKEIEKIKQFCKDYNLYYRIEEGESRLSTTSVFITHEKNRMKLLEKQNGRFCGYTDINVGKFLGFPEEDAKYFSENIKDGQIEPEAREKTKQMISERKIGQGSMKYLEVASYVPKPEEDNIKRCVDKGSEYVKAVEKFDEKHQLDVGKEVLKRYLNNL